MNIASFLSPKEEVIFLRDDMTIRQGLEKMKRYGYTAVPVIDAEDRYVGVVSEGDFLWNILSHNSELDSITMKSLEKLSIRDIIQNGKKRNSRVVNDFAPSATPTYLSSASITGTAV